MLQAIAKQLTPHLKGRKTGSPHGFVTAAFKGLKVDSFDDGKKETEGYLHLLNPYMFTWSMDNVLSSVLGTVGNAKGK